MYNQSNIFQNKSSQGVDAGHPYIEQLAALADLETGAGLFTGGVNDPDAANRPNDRTGNSMNSVFSSLLSPVLEKLLYQPIQKAGIWAARQSLGKTTGDADLAANAPAISAAEQRIAGSLADVATSQLTNDKLAQQVGIPTTEQALTAAASQVITGQSTLNLSSQTLLASFLSQNIVK